MLCSLCNGSTINFEVFNDRKYVQCTNCEAILLSTEHYLSPQAEKFRYSLHNNDVTDEAYINFVSPITQKIREDFGTNAEGLDFGCGTGPVISSELKKSGYKVHLYDPYFQPAPNLLKSKYDFIVCCEVMEHFHQAYKEFSMLKSLLKENGKLYCKTLLWEPDIDFTGWHYKNDETHVIFYSEKSIKWISNNVGFKKLEIFPDFLLFSR